MCLEPSCSPFAGDDTYVEAHATEYLLPDTDDQFAQSGRP